MSAPAAEPADEVLAAELASEATCLWALGQYDAALQALQRLDGAGACPDEQKVSLNLLVASYYADSSVSITTLTQQLAQWLEAHGPGDCPARNGYATAAINHGLALFVQQQHASAQAALEPLYADAEALHGASGLLLCVLLLEIYIGSGQLAKAAGMLQQLGAGAAAHGPPPPRASMGDEASSSGAHGSGEAADEQQQGQQQAGPDDLQQQGDAAVSQQQSGSEQQQQQQQQQRAVSPGAAPSSSGGCSIDLPSVSRSSSQFMQQVQPLVEARGGRLASPHVPALLHLYRARLAMACSNLKAARKELRALLALHPSSPAGLLLKAQLEVLRQQPRKVLKTISPLLTTQSITPSARLQLLNVLAAVHGQLGKHHAAALYLQAALSQHQQLQQQQLGAGTDAAGSDGGPSSSGGAGADVPAQRDSPWLALDVSDALLYNMGLQQLALHNWQAALDCFEAAAARYHNQPALWLRMAEASVGLFHEQRQQQQQEQAAGSQAQHGVGVGADAAGGSWAASAPPQQQQQGVEALLHQAVLQLSTGLALLQEQQAEAAKQAEAAAAAAAAAGGGEAAGAPPWPDAGGEAAVADVPHGMQPAAAASRPGAAGTPGQQQCGPLGLLDAAGMVSPDLPAIHQALLANLAHVQLLLANPEQALSAAHALLACSALSPQQHYLGSCYAAEALCLLGCHEEALQRLTAHAALPAGGATAAAAAAAAAAAPGGGQHDGTACSIKSDDDGSCAGCSSSRPGQAQQLPAGKQQQAALLANMAALTAAQGQWQEAHAKAAAAAALDAGSASAQLLLQITERLLLSPPGS